jgi:hypothetical protein
MCTVENVHKFYNIMQLIYFIRYFRLLRYYMSCVLVLIGVFDNERNYIKPDLKVEEVNLSSLCYVV